MKALMRRLQALPSVQDTTLPPIQFGEWTPDVPEISSSCPNLQDVIPFGPTGYKPMPDFAAVSTTALTARCQGAMPVFGADRTTYKFAGDATKLYGLEGAVWTDYSKGGGYTIASDEWWNFTKPPELDKILACHIDDPVQSVALGSTTFADHFTSTLKPKARYMTTVRDAFLMLANVDESGVQPTRVRWSARGDSTDMDQSAANQSDAEDLDESYGWIQGIFGGEDATVFQQNGITIGTYEGSPTIFRFDTRETARGLLAPKSAIRLGRNIYYLASDGFFRWDGGQSHNLSGGKINKTFFDDVEPTYYDRICSAVDYPNQMVMWAYTNTAATTATPNRILMYHWPSGWWARAHISVDFLFSDALNYTTLEALDNISSSIDALEFSLDSRVWAGGANQVGAFNTSFQSGTFTGSNLAAIIDTGQRQHFHGRNGLVTGAIPLVDGGEPTIQVAGAIGLNDTFTFETAAAQTLAGKCPLRKKARYHKYRLNVPAAATWTHATGIQPIVPQAGKR